FSNHSVPLLSMKEHIKRPKSQKKRWDVHRAHEALIVCTLERMAGIVDGLGLTGPALASIVLEAEDVQLAQQQPGGRRIRQPEVILPVAVLQDLATPMASAIHEQLDILWLTAGWSNGSPSFRGETWIGYEDSQVYNPFQGLRNDA
ncbi:hypothetical protein, partial [Rhizobium sp. PP-CC-3G-465]|uniref:hypothetical protein n=1 Tax=Rhizobium sp. PP-CC-3G-465 TaxID=2135648 RepID=UPI001404BF09